MSNKFTWPFLLFAALAALPFIHRPALIAAAGLFALIFVISLPVRRNDDALCTAVLFLIAAGLPHTVALAPLPIALYLSLSSRMKKRRLITASLSALGFALSLIPAAAPFVVPAVILLALGLETAFFLLDLRAGHFSPVLPASAAALLLLKLPDIAPFMLTLPMAFCCLRDLLPAASDLGYYRRLALCDALTGGQNRMAYYKDIDKMFKKNDQLRLVLFDLNDLKLINDRFGHGAGDEALRAAFDCIAAHFGALGRCYRIGGDEFACLIKCCDQERFEETIAKFKKEVALLSENFDYPFGIAIGFSNYNPETDICFEDFSNRVDEEMYKNKKEIKIC